MVVNEVVKIFLPVLESADPLVELEGSDAADVL